MFFVDPAQRPVCSDPLVARFVGKLPDLLRSHDRVAGQPFLLGPSGRPDVRVNTFFSRYPMTARDPDTWRKYAYALGMWLNFLAARAVGWDNAVPEDVEAFKYWRMADERNPQRVAPGTLTGNLIALSVFYTWAAARYGVVNPVVTRQVRAPGPHGQDDDRADRGKSGGSAPGGREVVHPGRLPARSARPRPRRSQGRRPGRPSPPPWSRPSPPSA